MKKTPKEQIDPYANQNTYETFWKRRKSTWNIILIPFGIFGFILTYYLQLKLLWCIHVLIYPEHKSLFKEFMSPNSVNHFGGFSSLLLTFPIIFSSLYLGLVIANILSWW